MAGTVVTFATIGALSYGAAALAFAMLTALMLTAWRGRLHGGLLVAAVGVSALWAAAAALNALRAIPPFSALELVEILRDGAWYVFLFSLLGYARSEGGATRRADLRIFAALLLAISAALAALIVARRFGMPARLTPEAARAAVIFGHLLLAVAGLALVELLYRNTRHEHRWAVKTLCFGLGGLFAYDLYLYANALLFRQIDPVSWHARGLVNAALVPLLALAAKRNPHWSLDVFVSRHVVFHSAALLGAGVYLVVMAAAGYYIRLFGGTWGGVAQIVFLSGAVVVLVLLLSSGQLRSRLRVFLAKHFYRNRYDYREEWLEFTHKLSASAGGGAALRENIAEAIARIVESPVALMWARAPDGWFAPAGGWHGAAPEDARLPPDDPLVGFLERSGWVVFLDELAREPGRYPGLVLPEAFTRLREAWVVVPLMHGERLSAFLVLARSPTKPALNWEDADLLKTVGRQAASYLALVEANEALAEARQFEAFNRLSAYVVHDLKNLVAQLGLVVRNAERYMDSPGFIEDAMGTVANATQKMNRLLAQLRKGGAEAGTVRNVALAEVAAEAVAARAAHPPAPAITDGGAEVRVRVERDRLAAVIEHIVQNAQEATGADGEVTVAVGRTDDGEALVEIADDGCGMDERFVRERLFRPFDTTKGNAGMGVGVYESREFVKQCGGRIEVDSTPGKGTVFRIVLPVAGDNMNAPEAGTEPVH